MPGWYKKTKPMLYTFVIGMGAFNVIIPHFVLLELHQRITQIIFVHKSSLFYMNKANLELKLCCQQLFKKRFIILVLRNPSVLSVQPIPTQHCDWLNVRKAGAPEKLKWSRFHHGKTTKIVQCFSNHGFQYQMLRKEPILLKTRLKSLSVPYSVQWMTNCSRNYSRKCQKDEMKRQKILNRAN